MRSPLNHSNLPHPPHLGLGQAGLMVAGAGVGGPSIQYEFKQFDWHSQNWRLTKLGFCKVTDINWNDVHCIGSLDSSNSKLIGHEIERDYRG